MKTYIFCLLCLVCPIFYVHCQDTLKPSINKWGTELNINPLQGSYSLNNANAQIKLRKFLSNSTALRLAFTLSFKQDNSKTDNPYGAVAIHEKEKRTTSSIILNIGQEKHFAGSRRLSPYIGYEASIGAKFSRDYSKDESGERTVKGAWQYLQYSYPYTSSYFTENGFWSVGLNAITGIDFYLVKSFYVGCEVAFGLDYINYANIEIDDEDETEAYADINETSWKFGPKLLNGIRIGYIF